jgi:hypothetical protein
MNCIDDCPEDALSFSMVGLDTKQAKLLPDVSRRRMLFSGIIGALGYPLIKIHGKNTDDNFSPLLIRPPGSVEESEFLEKSPTPYHCPWKGDTQYFTVVTCEALPQAGPRPTSKISRVGARIAHSTRPAITSTPEDAAVASNRALPERQDRTASSRVSDANM